VWAPAAGVDSVAEKKSHLCWGLDILFAFLRGFSQSLKANAGTTDIPQLFPFISLPIHHSK